MKQKLIPPIEECLCVKVELVQRQGNSITQFPEIYEQAKQIYHSHHRYSEPVTQVISLINKHWSNSELSLQSVANTLFLSPQYISRLFRQETGDTFGAYLTRKRIQEAMRLLQNPSLKTYEIAQKTGYTSQHYFSNAFKKALGISPVEYRRNVLGQGNRK